MVDILTAIITLLKTEHDIIDLLADRIYGAELPADELEYMPRKLIVIRYSGGLENNDYVGIIRPRVDCFCYGETYYEAGRVDRVLYDVLKYLKRVTIAGALIHSVAIGSGPHQMKHAQTGWPIVWRSCQVSASDQEIE